MIDLTTPQKGILQSENKTVPARILYLCDRAGETASWNETAFARRASLVYNDPFRGCA
jgi:hypothetical protein